MFISEEFKNFTTNTGFKLLIGEGVQSNTDQVDQEEDNQSAKALWAYQMACHGSTKSCPYGLVYLHTVILPWEIRTGSWRIERQEDLTVDDYKVLMMDDLEDLIAIGFVL